jgi:cytochrome c6
MKNSWVKAIGLLVLTGLLFLSLSLPARAEADLTVGAKVFKANCVACHIGGKNSVVSAKTLFQDALDANGINSAEAIINQVTNGKGSMPAFGSRLKPAQIESVAAYVLDQAAKGWKA